ncbi:ATP-binding protein [Aerosakkonema sp. BLCC-F2]
MDSPNRKDFRERIFSIANQLRYGLVSIAIASLAVTGGALIYLSFLSEVEQSRLLQQERSHSAASEIGTYLNDLQRQLNYLAGLRGLTEFSDQTLASVLEGLVNSNSAYEIVGIINNQGKVVQAMSPYKPISPSDPVLVKLAKSPLFSQTFKEGENYLGRVEIDPKTNLPITWIAVPIRNWKNHVDGVLFARINLNFLSLVMSQINVDKSGYVYVLDDRFNLIAKKGSTPNTFKIENLSQRPFIQNISKLSSSEADIEKFLIYRGLKGEEVLGAATLVRRVQWTVVVELPTAEVYDPVRRMTFVMGGSLFLVTVVVVTLGFAFSRSVVLPLEHLTDVASKISAGNLDIRVDITARNELGILAKTFNKMAEQLAEFYRYLEQKVADRTLELSEANQALEREIIERKQAEKELQQALYNLKQTQAQLLQTEKMSSLGQLVAGVAHEINNPVNFIHGNLFHINEYSGTLIRLFHLYRKFYPHPNPEVKEYIETADMQYIIEDLPKLLSSMKVGTDRIRNIVLTLRNFSRLDEAEMKQVRIEEGIESTLLILQSRFKSKPLSPGIEVMKEYGYLPDIECYSGQLNQVFMNIISNAIDALQEKDKKRSPEEIKNSPSRITIRTEVIDRDWVRICIKDNGSGITDDVKAKIFDPFFTTKPVGQGTGLGLSICYQIVVDQHGGNLKCLSQPGEGTEFWIDIPVRQTSKEARAPVQ